MRNWIHKRNVGFIMGILGLFVSQLCRAQTKNHYSADIVASWNRLILETAVAEDGLLTLKGVRTASMAHAAMHDAVNAIDHRYLPYVFTGSVPEAHPLAGAAQAAYEVAVDQYPGEEMKFVGELEKWLSGIENQESKNKGISLGKEVASTVLEIRSNDRWNSEAEYTWHPMGPGVYAEFNEHSGTPEGFVFGAGWAEAKPFMLRSSSHFRSPPPPEINSNAYSRAFNEVKEYGRFHSKKRTADQAHLAMWCKDFVENSHNRLARDLVVKENLDLWEASRLFALMNMAIYDAYVNVFDNKFFYNHWRPYTAIRWAANDGNPDTKPDTAWNNLHRHTYAFPSYPSAHGTASAAAMTVLANVLGTGNDYSFEMKIARVDKAGPFSEKIEMDPAVRTFDSFSEAARAFSFSRVYLGIHFRYDSEEGVKLGTRVGQYAVRNYLIRR